MNVNVPIGQCQPQDLTLPVFLDGSKYAIRVTR